jgi:hypothetical protein
MAGSRRPEGTSAAALALVTMATVHAAVRPVHYPRGALRRRRCDRELVSWHMHTLTTPADSTAGTFEAPAGILSRIHGNVGASFRQGKITSTITGATSLPIPRRH